ncbi:sterol desaturase family protein [Aliiroseovarius subalbicans]|uniref:sterol desaturase family protein n=1 Tax=Aliiroseovarius subalbicans TaxID=2925840 RepID=UPI001F5652E4|nr:sterol desaturase family protein [Aliiroseovarius subalbicans]MCI2398195.1 sterol desaturase family protein [Aliiroseovarius subalbicans]
MLDWLPQLYVSFFGSDVAVAPEYLGATVLIAWILYRWQRGRGGFWRWLLPREIYRHKSHKLDLALFAIGRVVVFTGVVGRVSLTVLIAGWVAGLTGDTGASAGVLSPVVLALAIWLMSDFAVYWAHRLHHQVRVIWPLHAVHHSAEVLTPLTAYRQHPLSYFVTAALQSSVLGALQGVLIGRLAPDTVMTQIAGINAFIVLANLTLANFHHSHLWIRFPVWLEHIFISPAQHQIHHSIAPDHYNRNYGQILALWDWAFGTLRLSRGEAPPQIGLSDPEDAPLMTHSLGTTLWLPIRRMMPRRWR